MYYTSDIEVDLFYDKSPLSMVLKSGLGSKQFTANDCGLITLAIQDFLTYKFIANCTISSDL